MSVGTVVLVADVGSVAKGNFQWVSSAANERPSNKPDHLADCIVAHLEAGRRVALGFESPLFVPVPEREDELGKARNGECTPETGNRPFSAGPGASLLATAVQSLVWVLNRVKRLRSITSASISVREFQSRVVDILVWEAFVSGKEKAQPPSHVVDAQLAIAAFESAMKNDCWRSAIRSKGVFSLAGAAILHAGLSDDLTLLQQPCLVLRPIQREARHV